MNLFLTYCICIGCVVSSNTFAQGTTFAFLAIPTSAQWAALGGVNVSLTENLAHSFMANPALLSIAQPKQIAVSYSPYFATTHYTVMNYIPKKNWGLSIQNLNYGAITNTDNIGKEMGTFSAQNTAISLSHARKQGNISLGINVKWAISVLDSYKASALLADIGGLFKHPTKDFSTGLVFKNFGVAFNNFGSLPGTLPFDVQAGLTFKAKHAPFRISLVARQLHQWKNITFGQRLSGGAEILLSQNLEIQMGYNQQIRDELRNNNTFSMAGFATGFRVHSLKMDWAYSYSFQHIAAGSHYFTFGFKW